MTEHSIQEVARLSGVTSRTLRHYGEVGLLAPSRVGTGGLRHYDDASLVRLQRTAGKPRLCCCAGWASPSRRSARCSTGPATT